MKALIAQSLTQCDIGGEDKEILRHKSLNVNMRLYNSNLCYKAAIREIVLSMSKVLISEFEDYAMLKGISGANFGMPLNIVCINIINNKGLPAIKHNMHLPDVFSFLNPKIIKHSRSATIVESNCGSINLSMPIKVARYNWIDLEYYNMSGDKVFERYSKPLSFTIQHEVDHNAGVLITDKMVKEIEKEEI